MIVSARAASRRSRAVGGGWASAIRFSISARSSTATRTSSAATRAEWSRTSITSSWVGRPSVTSI